MLVLVVGGVRVRHEGDGGIGWKGETKGGYLLPIGLNFIGEKHDQGVALQGRKLSV